MRFHTRARRAIGLQVALITAAALPMAAGARAAVPTAPGASTVSVAPAVAPGEVRVAALRQDPRQLSDFWTPERMRGARHLTAEPRSPRLRSVGTAGQALRRGEPTLVQPAVPAAAPVTGPAPTSSGRRDFPDGGSPWHGHGLVNQTLGTVFLTSPAVIGAVACDGVAVQSHNKSVVLTKGSCTDLIDSSITSWVFAPGYHDGCAPFGLWMATQLFALPEWHRDVDENYDVGAATVVSIPPGRALVDTVGGQGVAFNQVIHPHPNVYLFGYWSQKPEALYYCSGRSVDDPNTPPAPHLPQALYCPGAVGKVWGSPWFLGFDEETGVGIVNSIGIGNFDKLDYQLAPYFGDRIQDLYNQAQDAPVAGE
ncbi:hypothetical protein ACFZB9_18765 [Kitasatospora sp. NPDC008050]|uniref:trypsin-like serine peptidase n=1 Tax=Kitasatospora sp. NPDC008050 TaxID=3364021 RepID=UPI0036EF5F57